MFEKQALTNNRPIYFALTFAMCMSAFTVDVALPALPDILKHFGAPDANGHQVLGFYLLGLAIGQIPIGFLSDRYGRLPVFYTCLIVFILLAAVTVFSTSIEMLLAARLAQGFVGASGPVLARAIARDITSGRELAKLTSLLVSSLAISTLVAPVFGAIMMEFWGWRSTFALSLVMGVITLLLFTLFVKETNPVATALKGFPAESNSLLNSLIQQFLTSLRAFTSSPQSLWGTGLVSLTFFAYLAIVSGIAQVVVDVYGMSSRHVAMVFGGAVVFYLASAQAGRYALRYYSSIQLMKLGFWGYFVSVLMCALILWGDSLGVWLGPWLDFGKGNWQGFWFFWWALVPFLIGKGLIFSNATAITLEPLPQSAGFASSIFGTIQMLSASSAALLVGYLYARTVESMVLVLLLGALTALILFVAGLKSPKLRSLSGLK